MPDARRRDARPGGCVRRSTRTPHRYALDGDHPLHRSPSTGLPVRFVPCLLPALVTLLAVACGGPTDARSWTAAGEWLSRDTVLIYTQLRLVLRDSGGAITGGWTGAEMTPNPFGWQADPVHGRVAGARTGTAMRIDMGKAGGLLFTLHARRVAEDRVLGVMITNRGYGFPVVFERTRGP